jgi:hypothetical protein
MVRGLDFVNVFPAITVEAAMSLEFSAGSHHWKDYPVSWL